MSMSRLVVMASSFVGILIIAHLGHDVLAASALISSVQSLLFFSGLSLLFSVGAMIAHAYGGEHHEDVGSVFQQSLLFACLVSIPIIIIQWNIKKILLLFGQTLSISVLVQDYFYYFSIGTPALACNIVCQQFILAVNRRRLVFFLSIVSLIFSIGLAWILVNGLLGLPKLGVGGLGLAYSIQTWLIFFIYLYYCYSKKEFAHYELFTWRLRDTFHFLKALFHLGWPITIQTSCDVSVFFLFTIFAGWLGINELAAQQIVNQYFFLLCVPIFAMARSSTILVGQSRGANDIDDIRHYHLATLGFSLFFSVVVLLAFILFPEHLINLFVSKNTVMTPAFKVLATTLLILMGCRLFFDAIFEVNVGSLRGLYDTRYSMAVTVLFILILNIPFAYFLGFVLHLGLIGMMLSSVIMTILSALTVWRRWRSILRRAVSR